MLGLGWNIGETWTVLGIAAGTLLVSFLLALFHASLNMASGTSWTESTSAAAASIVVVMAWAILILRRSRGNRDHPVNELPADRTSV